MPRGSADVRENNFLGQSPDRGTVGEKSWLRVTRRRELLGGPLEAETAQIGAKRGIDLTKNPFREGKSLSEVFSHSRLLRALPGIRRSMSDPVSLAPSRARSAASDIDRTACLKTSRPAIFTRCDRFSSTSADIGVVAPPSGRYSRSASFPSLRM